MSIAKDEKILARDWNCLGSDYVTVFDKTIKDKQGLISPPDDSASGDIYFWIRPIHGPSDTSAVTYIPGMIIERGEIVCLYDKTDSMFKWFQNTTLGPLDSIASPPSEGNNDYFFYAREYSASKASLVNQFILYKGNFWQAKVATTTAPSSYLLEGDSNYNAVHGSKPNFRLNISAAHSSMNLSIKVYTWTGSTWSGNTLFEDSVHYDGSNIKNKTYNLRSGYYKLHWDFDDVSSGIAWNESNIKVEIIQVNRNVIPGVPVRVFNSDFASLKNKGTTKLTATFAANTNLLTDERIDLQGGTEGSYNGVVR